MSFTISFFIPVNNTYFYPYSSSGDSNLDLPQGKHCFPPDVLHGLLGLGLLEPLGQRGLWLPVLRAVLS